jgi:hypothetical protein
MSSSTLSKRSGRVGRELTFGLQPILQFVAGLSPALQIDQVLAVSYSAHALIAVIPLLLRMLFRVEQAQYRPSFLLSMPYSSPLTYGHKCRRLGLRTSLVASAGDIRLPFFGRK